MKKTLDKVIKLKLTLPNKIYLKFSITELIGFKLYKTNFLFTMLKG